MEGLNAVSIIAVGGRLENAPQTKSGHRTITLATKLVNSEICSHITLPCQAYLAKG